MIENACFQDAWLSAVGELSVQHWEAHNVIVYISNVNAIKEDFHNKYSDFCAHIGIKGPKDVAYTIFPYKYARKFETPDDLFQSYNKKFVPRLKRMKNYGWGTYFQRMTDYDEDGTKNQLLNIINAINDRVRYSKAAFTIVIHKPGGETIRPRGGPCLMYIAVQICKDHKDKPQISFLAVYRNHDFLERAYGNYLGLINLLKFVANATGLEAGSLTCISSHAYVDRYRTELQKFMGAMK